MKYYKIIIIAGFIRAAFGSKELECEPFATDYQSFDEAILSLLNDIQEYSKSSLTDPTLASTHALSLTCEANNAIIFAAKAVSRLSGIDSSVIIDILNGTSSEPFDEPLNCIESELIDLRDQILNIRDNMAPAVEAKAEPLKAPEGICLGVLTRINAYIPNAMATMSTKSVIISRENAEFSAIGMNDLYQEYLRSICILDIIESSMSAILNTDASPAIAYIKDETTSLPYPFTCFEIFIDFLKNGFMQQLDMIFDGSLSALTVPELS